MGQVTGIVKIYINGSLQRSKEGASLDFGGKEREMVVGHSVYGYKEKVAPAVLEFTMAHLVDTDLIALGETVGATARFECDTGITYIITNACVTKTVKLKGSDGEVEVEMQGDPADEE